MTETNPMARLRDAINSHDPQRIADCFTEDYRSELPMHPSQDFQGNSHVRDNWMKILARTPDLKADVLRFHAGNPTWSEWEMRGTSTDGTAALIRGCVISTFRGDLIDWTRFYLDPVTDGAFYPDRVTDGA
jgi:ketosteroid isomerase-like protein